MMNHEIVCLIVNSIIYLKWGFLFKTFITLINRPRLLLLWACVCVCDVCDQKTKCELHELFS